MTQRVEISCCPQPEGVLERRVAEPGFALRPSPEDAGASQRRRMAVLTAVCLLALAAGALLELVSGVPRVAPLAFFVLAYLSGGYYSTRNAIAALRERTVDVNLLMVTAAVGAATIDYWQEGAVLMFLFSLSNTLESFAMARTRRAITQLMTAHPEGAPGPPNGGGGWGVRRLPQSARSARDPDEPSGLRKHPRPRDPPRGRGSESEGRGAAPDRVDRPLPHGGG